jgi:phosphatidate phosphatase APP1
MRKTTALAVLLIGLAACGLAAWHDRAAVGGIVDEARTILAPLLFASDILAEPDKEVKLAVCLRADAFLKGVEGKRVQFLLGDKVLGEVKTDKHGDALLAWKVPAKPDDYVIQAQVRAEDQPSTIIAPADLLVAARKAEAPMIAVDLDKTVVASGFSHVLTGSATAMAGASDVLTRVAKTQTVIYLTQRPDFLGLSSKKWLADNGFPRGPMLTTTVAQLAEASGAYKSGRLAELRKTYKNIAFGIGDKLSDAEAYAANGLRPIMILAVNWADPSPAVFEKLSRQVDAAPESTQVVTSWAEISQVLFEKAEFTKKAMTDRLQAATQKLRAKKKG